LSQDIRGDRHVHALTEVLVAHALRDYLLLIADGLEVLVEALIAKHNKDNARSLLVIDEGLELLCKAESVVTPFDLNPRRILNTKA
jgi:hypothetical protein